MYVSVEYDLGFALGKKNKSFALASVCFIVQAFEALVCECRCQGMWLRMRALCAKEASFLWLLLQPQLPVTGLWASTGSEEVSHLYRGGHCLSREASGTSSESGVP